MVDRRREWAWEWRGCQDDPMGIGQPAPRAPDHGEAVVPVGPAEDRVIPFVTSFAMLASHGHTPRPMGGGQAVCT